jgi:protein TonB
VPTQTFSKLQAWFAQNRITAFVVLMHLVLIVGIQISPDRPKTGANMGDTVMASLLDPNPQKEKAKVSQPVPEKPKAPEKKTPEPVVTTSAPSSLTSTQTQDSSTAKPTSTGGTSTMQRARTNLPQSFSSHGRRR